MKTMMLADFLALAKSLPKNVALWALLATGICLAAGNATPIILLTGFPMSHMVLMPMLLRDQRRDWVAFRQALPLSRANVVAGRYASIAVVVAGCVALGVAAYTTACIVNAVVPGLPLVRHFAVGFDAAGVVSFAAGTFALTIAMFSVLLPFMFADSHRKLASYIPFAFMLALMGWIYIFRSMNFDAFLPLVGRRRRAVAGRRARRGRMRHGGGARLVRRIGARGGSRVRDARPLAHLNQIGQRHVVHVILDGLVEPTPEIDGHALIAARTRLRAVFEA